MCKEKKQSTEKDNKDTSLSFIKGEEESGRFSSFRERKTTEVTEENISEIVSNYVKKEIEKEIAVDKASLFTVFGVFASIVTFVSVEIQILKIICDFWNIAGFSLIILASLLMFILLLDYIGRGWRNECKIKFPWFLTIFIIIIFLGGVILANLANEQLCRENLIYQRYERDFTSRQVEIERMFDDKMKSLESGIQKNSEQINALHK